MADSKAVILIGMPGAGKSTIGVMLAKLLAKPFVDTDLMIQQLCGTTLQHHLDEFGFESLRNLEHRVLLTGGFQNKVVATGGSVVYSTAGMTRLKHEGLCVFLDVPLAVLTRRVNNMSTRGIAAAPGTTFETLYHERMPLYRRYADITLDCGPDEQPKSQDDVLAEILHQLESRAI